MIRWIDMIDPVYTLALLAGVDPDKDDLTGINIGNRSLTIYWKDPSGIRRHKTVPYILESEDLGD